MEFFASLYRVQVDNEGESKIILTCPQTELEKIIFLTQQTQKLLRLKVEVVEQ